MNENDCETYKSRKLKPLINLGGNALFLFLIAKSVIDGSYTSFPAFAGLVFFGAGTILFAILLLPGSSYLKITDEGFQCCYLFRKRKFISWSDVAAFEVFTVWAGAYYRKGAAFKLTNGHDKQRQITLPDNYGLKADKLALLMNRRLDEFREKACSQHALRP